MQRKEPRFAVGPVLLGFFLFVVVGSSTSANIRRRRHGGRRHVGADRFRTTFGNDENVSIRTGVVQIIQSASARGLFSSKA